MKRDDKKFPKYNFSEMKAAAMSDDPQVRKNEFCDYFARFGELPSFLFDTEHTVDARLLQTISDITNDPHTSLELKQSVARLVQRLPSI